MKPLNLQPNTTELVSPERFLEILAQEPGNIAYAEVIPGNLGGPHLGGKILIRRKKTVFQYQSLNGDHHGESAPATRSSTRASLLGEIGRIIHRIAGNGGAAEARA